MSEDLVIDEKNFNRYFFDVRTNKPQPGQIMACYTAIAEFIDGNEKRQIIDLICRTDKAHAIAQVMRKLLFASEKDANCVPIQISEDLMSGMSVEDVLKKPYKYTVEMFFYTKPEYMPKNDPHWTTVSLLNVSDTVKIDIPKNS